MIATARALLTGLIVIVIIGATLTVSAPAMQITPEVRDRVLPAVVQIAIMVETRENGETRFEWIPVGSGTIVAPDGVILTNWHVVDMAAHRDQLDEWASQATRDGSDLTFDLDSERLLVMTTEGIGEPQPAYQARIITEHHALDFAVLRISDDADGSSLDPGELEVPFVPIGNSAEARQGDAIHVFGYPAIGGGTLQYTSGVVSGFGFESGIDGPAWLTTDASVSGGSSGGAAVDATGRLIGVPTQGGSLDCRPGDTNLDGEITADDVGCIPTGGSIGQLRPVNLAIPLLERAGWTAQVDFPSGEPMLAQQDVPTSTPDPTNTPAPTSTLAPTNTPVPSPTSPPEPTTDTLNSTPNANVPMDRANPARTGLMPGPDPAGELGVLWEKDLGKGMLGPPVLVDGVIYASAGFEYGENGIVIALDAESGAEIWRRDMESEFTSSPTVNADKLYLASRDGHLFVLETSDGSISTSTLTSLDAYPCVGGTSPLIAGDLIFTSFGCFGPEDTAETIPWPELSGTLIAFDMAGTEKWRFEYAGFTPLIAPAIGNDIIVIADSQDAEFGTGSVYAVDASTGKELWRFDASDGVDSTPILTNALAIVGGRNGSVFALDLNTGLERWRFKLGNGAGAPPAFADDLVFVSEYSKNVAVLDASTGIQTGEFSSSASFAPLTLTEHSIWIGGRCSNLQRVDRYDNESHRLFLDRDCSPVTSVVVSDHVVYVGTEAGKLYALGDSRRSIPMAVGLSVEVSTDKASVRAAPSSGAVVRGEASRGDKATITGPSEERSGEIWWPIDVEGLGSGWIIESSLIAAAVPIPTPAPTATRAPTTTESVPDPTPTRPPSIVVVETPEPDRDISAQTQPLLAFLPTQEQVPAGLVLADEAERSKADVVASLGGSDEASQLLDDWGWSGNAFREYIAAEDAVAPGGTTYLNIAVHRFADAESAANALVFFSDQVVLQQGLQEVEAPAIGETARLLFGSPDGVPLAVLYAQEGPIMYRIGGSTNAAESDPSAEVLAVANAILK